MKLVYVCILTVMSIVLSPSAAVAEPERDVKYVSTVVTESEVIAMLYKFHASHDAIINYGEVAAAIAKASSEDSLFPGKEDGSKLTAAILVSLAWHESRFRKDAVGDQGRSFGLYQIQPPTARVKSTLLTRPRDASFIAIDLIRSSIRHCIQEKRHWSEALAWYAASSPYGSRLPVVVQKSKSRMALAAKLYEEFFAGEDTEPVGLMLSQKENT